MQYRNDGSREEYQIQNQFTAYLQVALKRRKNAYLSQRHRQQQQSASPALLQAAQALMPDGAQAEDVPAPAPITRAQAAVLVNCALGREPDTEAINGVHRSLLLDVPEDRADYADLVEAVLPHDYYLDGADTQEHYRADALDALSFTPGIHLSGTSGFFVVHQPP